MSMLDSTQTQVQQWAIASSAVAIVRLALRAMLLVVA